MEDFRRNELIDKLYERYLDSFSLTLDTMDATGDKVYDFYLLSLLKFLKLDVSEIDKTMKKYKRFSKLKRKYEIKLDRLQLKYGAVAENCFRSKLLFKKMKKLNKKHYKRLQKYKIYLPEDLFKEEIEKV